MSSPEQHIDPQLPSGKETRGRFRLLSPPPIKTSINSIPVRLDVYRAKLIFYLFLASLGVFFCAGLLTYWIIRTQSFMPITREYLTLELPRSFWLSTLALVFVSGFLQLAVWCVRRECQIALRRWLLLAWISAIAFLAIQYSGMTSLWNTHFTADDGSTKIYGICFTMAFLHALHVLGGILFLAWVIFQAHRNRYDHERNFAVEHCAAYWHFLDVVWVIMLIVFLFTG